MCLPRWCASTSPRPCSAAARCSTHERHARRRGARSRHCLAALFVRGAATEADQRAFEAWFAASPLHQAAWQHLEAALGSALHAIDPRLLSASGALRRSLLRPQEAQRRRLNKLLLTAGGLVGGAVCLDRFLPLTHVAADYLTGTGQRRTVALPDGAIMELDARSAASVDFSGGRRLVRLEAGAIVVRLADGADAVGGAPPLRIQTAQGAVLPRSGSVLVQCAEDRSQCVALTGQAGIVSVGGQQRLLAEGRARGSTRTGSTRSRRRRPMRPPGRKGGSRSTTSRCNGWSMRWRAIAPAGSGCPPPPAACGCPACSRWTIPSAPSRPCATRSRSPCAASAPGW
ncbi:FecR domain-containing protein [Achromobacter xylosoxidans]